MVAMPHGGGAFSGKIAQKVDRSEPTWQDI